MTFWKPIKPFLADKTKKFSRITLIEVENISEDNEIVKIFHDYFINVPTQNIPTNQEFEFIIKDPLLRIIEKYHNHPNIILIKTKNKSQTFRFNETNFDEIKKSIQNLDPKKVSQKSDMNTNILRKNSTCFARYIAMITMSQFTLQSFTLN